jgi:hypothetical protein
MFNSFDFERKLNTQDLINMDTLEKAYSIAELSKKIKINTAKPAIRLDLLMGKG